jgi:beta-glucosidase
MMDYNIRHGRTYMYSKAEPLYPFGFGLSYTTFGYSRLRTSASKLTADGNITVSVNVKNTGKRAGEEVVQLYVKHLDSKVERPAKELRGFQRVALKAGETKTVQLPLPAKSLAYWDTTKQAYVVEPDNVEISVGGSSVDGKLKTKVKVQ